MLMTRQRSRLRQPDNQAPMKDQPGSLLWPPTLRMLPMILVMGIIFFLSQQPGDSLDLPDIPDLDKVLHALIYGVLAATTLFAISPEKRRAAPGRASLFVILFCVLYGISDELHQSFVPGRMPDILDLIADTTGATLMVCLWRLFRAR